jgi:nicotinamide-nucleotide amidase
LKLSLNYIFPKIQKMIHAEIVTIGDEILYGQIIDTNSSWIGSALSNIGIKVLRRASVGDEASEILDILAQAGKRAHLVIVTGGLGPTKDDITKHCFAQFFGSELALNSQALELVTEFFRKRGRTLTTINEQQAWLPACCTYIPNHFGTAPGMWFEQDGTVYVSLPGVPSEMKGIMTEQILPKLQGKFDLPVIHHKIIKTIGIGESYLAEIIADWETALPPHIKLAYLPSLAEVKLRLTCHGNNKQLLENEADKQIFLLKKIIPQYIYGYDNDELMHVIATQLLQQKLSVSTAESCTGGYLSHLFTALAGSSQYFEGGLVSYSNAIKEQILGVNASTLAQYGAVSEQTIAEMAQNIRLKLKTDIGLATSGIAGPSGGSEAKPVGTVWIALAHANGVFTKKLQLGGSRVQNIQLSATILLNLLRKYLIKQDLS